MIRQRKASWKRRQEGPRIHKPAAERLLPRVSLTHLQQEKSWRRNLGGPEQETEAKAVLGAEKEQSISGDQEKALGSPLRASVKGRRSRAAPEMNFL